MAQPKQQPKGPANWDKPRLVAHVRFHTGYQIKNSVYQSLDSTKHEPLKVEMWLLPNGMLDIKMQDEQHVIGLGMYHGVRLENNLEG